MTWSTGKKKKKDGSVLRLKRTNCGWNLTRNQLFYGGRGNRAGHSDRIAINNGAYIRQWCRLKKVNVDALGLSRATDVHREKQVLTSSRQKGVRKKISTIWNRRTNEKDTIPSFPTTIKSLNALSQNYRVTKISEDKAKESGGQRHRSAQGKKWSES